MADYRKHIPFIQEWEGGWSDNPADRGGATMMGITLTTYTSFRKKINKPIPDKEDLMKISRDEWNEIYKTMFWNVIKGDMIDNQSVADAIVDWYWMSGITAIKRVQKIVGVTADGVVGPLTLRAINGFITSRDLFFQIRQARINHIESIVRLAPSQRVFYRGWMNRINALEYEEN